MKNSKADQTNLLAELRRLECKPPKRADRLIARHLRCEQSQSLAHAVAEAARRSSSGAMPVLDANRTATPTDIALLGQGCGETLGSLSRIPTIYRLDTNGERLYRLCLALVERTLADAKLWQQTGEVAVVFARSAIQKLIEEFTGGALTDKIDYCFEVWDDLRTGYWQGGALGEGKLMAAFDLQARGYLKIGSALDALEKQEQFLGASR
jgi:hypothetical protein